MAEWPFGCSPKAGAVPGGGRRGQARAAGGDAGQARAALTGDAMLGAVAALRMCALCSSRATSSSTGACLPQLHSAMHLPRSGMLILKASRCAVLSVQHKLQALFPESSDLGLLSHCWGGFWVSVQLSHGSLLHCHSGSGLLRAHGRQHASGGVPEVSHPRVDCKTRSWASLVLFYNISYCTVL